MAKKGPQTPAGKAKALANLRPAAPWKKGQSGNPKGRPPAGMTIIEHVNAMAELSRPQIEAIRDDEDESVARRAAARLWLDAMTGERSKGGNPIAGPELDRILDRTKGKPKQAVDLTTDGKPLEGRPVLVVPPAMSEDEWAEQAKRLASSAPADGEESPATPAKASGAG